MKMKRIASILLALVMVLSALVIVPVSATTDAGATEVTPTYKRGDDGTKAISESGANKNTSEWVITIDNADEFITFAKTVNKNGGGTGYNKATIVLTSDIDFADKGENPFYPIGWYCQSAGFAFQGIFDGQGYSIKNLHLNYCVTNKAPYTIATQGADGKYTYSDGTYTLDCVGLFGYATNTIKNVVLDETCSITATGTDAGHGATAGIVALGANVKIINCINGADVSCAGGSHAAGIAGRGNTTIENCTNLGTITGTNDAAGIVAYAYSSLSVTGCANYGTVYCGAIAGGIVARAATEGLKVTDCVNYGEIQSIRVAAGIVGRVRKNITISNCTNYGLVGPLEKGEHGTAANLTNQRFDAKEGAAFDGIYNKEYGKTPTVTVTNCSDRSAIGYQADAVVKADLSNAVAMSTLFTKGGDNGLTLNDGQSYKNATVITINNAAEMQMFSILINVYDPTNGGSGKTFVMTADIDMTSYDQFTYDDLKLTAENAFAPIGWALMNTLPGSQTVRFRGTFDGQGHTVNFIMKPAAAPKSTAQGGYTAVAYFGLFGGLHSATIKNLVIGDKTWVSYTTQPPESNEAYYGILAAFNYGVTRIDNVKVGGKGGHTCDPDKKDVILPGNIAGFVARDYNPVKITRSTFSANLYASGRIGGFISWSLSGATAIVNCVSSGNAQSTPGSNAGGFVAISRAVGLNLINCVNLSSVCGKNAGAMIGEQDQNATIMYYNCYNHGSFTSSMYVPFDHKNELWGLVTTNTKYTVKNIVQEMNTKNVNASMYSDLLHVSFQTNKQGDVRLVTTIDDRDYKNIKFVITRSDGKVATVMTNEVYTSVLASDEITTEVKTASDVGGEFANYIAALTLTGAAGQTFTVQILVTDYNNVVLHGATRTVKVPAVEAAA